jgi:fatty acid desaturase
LPALTVAEATRAYAHLKAEVARAGLFERSLRFYAGLALFAFGGYAASVYAIAVLDQPALLGLACLSFSFFSVQVAGLMHDSGHRAVFASVRNNDLLGYVSAALLGMVFDNWKTRHNMHHAHPNQEDLDPDMEVPFIAVSGEALARKAGVQRWLLRFQAYYYFPLGSIVSFSNRLGTVTYFLRNRSLAEAWKLALYATGIAFLFVSPFLAFSFEKALFVFLAVHLSTGVYLANCFAPNHKGMPVVAPGETYSFLEQQVITARNVRGGFLTDLLLVGLNHQVEHHLFPYTPRDKLRRLQPYVVAACREAGIPYTEVGLVETNRILLGELHAVGRLTGAALPSPSLAQAE